MRLIARTAAPILKRPRLFPRPCIAQMAGISGRLDVPLTVRKVKVMSAFDSKQAGKDFQEGKLRDVQHEHWKTQQDYNAALEAARRAADEKR